MSDNGCLKWCTVRYLHPAHNHPARIRKIDEILSDDLGFETIKFIVKIKDIHKIKKKNFIDISVFGYGYKKTHLI